MNRPLSLLCFSLVGALSAQDGPAGKVTFAMPDGPFQVAAPDQVRDALFGARPAMAWKPQAAPVVKERGAAKTVYPTAAPAVVVVRTLDGHGTGWIVDASGIVVTNHHVIADAKRDPVSGGRIAHIHVGTIGPDGVMKLSPKAYDALVLKADPDKDLAMLRIFTAPKGTKFPALKLAATAPGPGTDTVSIGHPAAGLLWTSRSCEVSGHGTWPEDAIDIAMSRLAASGTDKRELEEALKQMKRRRITLTTCGINPGDSGGPVMNAKGELVAVTFAIPKGGTDKGISLDKFAYHVHLDEVKAFLKVVPTTPEVHAPGPWPAATRAQILDTDNDNRPDAIVFSNERSVTGVMIDARNRTQTPFTMDDLRTDSRREKFKFDVAIHVGKGAEAFYDTDGDGDVDLILSDPEGTGTATSALKKTTGRWAPADFKGARVIDVNRVVPDARPRFAAILGKLSSSGKK